jgi:hypothetical protein
MLDITVPELYIMKVLGSEHFEQKDVVFWSVMSCGCSKKNRHFGGRRYVTNQKVAGSRPDEVNDFYHYLILPVALGPGVYSASNRNEYQKHKNNVSGGVKQRPVCRADNLTTIYEPIV